MRFADWLQQNRVSQSKAAEALGVTQGRVSQVALGDEPSMRLARKIIAYTDGAVTFEDLVRETAA